VTLLHISELAERSGVPSSTLRYYERIGLVRPAGRADNGYRVYDDAALERLAFIGRAKRLGMRLDEVAALVEAWLAGDCGPVQEQLRGFVAGRLAELRGHIAEDVAFEAQLERILNRLEQIAPRPAGCGPDCGCDTDPLDVSVAGPPAACSLTPATATARLGEWQELFARATHLARRAERTVVVFDPSPRVAGELGALCAAEVCCCPGFRFTLQVTATAITLIVDGQVGLPNLSAAGPALHEGPR
jgi:DNA-binding transcriptional MerR regulator